MLAALIRRNNLIRSASCPYRLPSIMDAMLIDRPDVLLRVCHSALVVMVTATTTLYSVLFRWWFAGEWRLLGVFQCIHLDVWDRKIHTRAYKYTDTCIRIAYTTPHIHMHTYIRRRKHTQRNVNANWNESTGTCKHTLTHCSGSNFLMRYIHNSWLFASVSYRHF